MRINEFVRSVHETAKSKGWWNSPRDNQELHQLMVTEVSEASEEARIPNNPPIYQQNLLVSKVSPDFKVTPNMKEWLPEIKPEGEAIEIVDCIIRLADYVGHRGWDLEKRLSPHNDPKEMTIQLVISELIKSMEEMKAADPTDVPNERPLANHFELTKLICQAEKDGDVDTYATLFCALIGYMTWRGWNVEEAIRIKTEYNTTRSYRHGGKLA